MFAGQIGRCFISDLISAKMIGRDACQWPVMNFDFAIASSASWM